MRTHNACPRGCGGSLVADWNGSVACSLCVRSLDGPRPPTAEERKAQRKPPQEPTYHTGQSAAMLRAKRVL